MAISTRDAADRILNGALAGWIAVRRDQGDSYNEIAFTLRTEHGIAVTGETVRVWHLADNVAVSPTGDEAA